MIAAVGSVLVKSPISETPKELVLYPPVCAPSTGTCTPPYRPSKTRPYLSTRKL
jgi:hypothetical protein